MANDLLVGVTIGAALSGSFKAVFGRAERAIDTLGSAIDLTTNRQQRLGNVISRSMGRGSSHLGQMVRRYREMDRAIEKARRSQLALSSSVNRQKAGREFRQNMRGKTLESGAKFAVAGGVFGKTLQIFSRQEDAATDLKMTMMKANGSVGEFNKVLKQTKQLGKFLPGTTTDFIHLGQALKSQGMSDELLLGGGLENAAKLNVVMNMGQAEGGEFFMKMTESYGLSDKELGKAADITQRGYTAFGLKKDDMFETMKYSAPTVNTLGLTGVDNYEKLMAVQGMGAQQGLEGSSFGTNFSQMLSRFAKGPKMMAEAKRGMKAEAQEIIETAGVTFDFFDKKGNFKGIESMMGELEKLETIKKTQGEKAALIVADAMFGAEAARPALILANFSAAMEQLGGVLELTAGTIGSAFAPEIKSLAGTVQNFVETTLQPWIAENKELIKWVVSGVVGFMGVKTAIFAGSYALSAFISPFRSVLIGFQKLSALSATFTLLRLSGLSRGVAVLKIFGLSTKNATRVVGLFGSVFGKLRGAITLVGKAFLWLGRALLTNPIGLAITVIAGGAYLIYKNWGTIKQWFSDIWDSVSQRASSAWNVITTTWTNVSTWFSEKWNAVKQSASMLWSGVGNLATNAWNSLASVWSNVGNWFGEKWASIGNFFNSGIANITATIINWSPIGLFHQAFTAVLSWFGIELPAKFTNFGKSIVDGIGAGITNGAMFVQEKIIGIGTSIKTWFMGVLGINSPSRVFAEFGTHLMQGLINGLSAMLGKVREKIVNIGSSVTNWFKEKLGIHSPSRVFMQLGGFVSEGLGIGIEQMAKSPLNATKKMAQAIGNTPMPSLARPFVDMPNPNKETIPQGDTQAMLQYFNGIGANQSNATLSGINVTFSPNINVTGTGNDDGIAKNVQQAITMSLTEFERMMNEVLDQRSRRSYI